MAVVRSNKTADDLFCLHLKQRAFSIWRLFIYQQTLRRASKLFIMEKRQNILQSKSSMIYIMNTVKQCHSEGLGMV